MLNLVFQVSVLLFGDFELFPETNALVDTSSAVEGSASSVPVRNCPSCPLPAFLLARPPVPYLSLCLCLWPYEGVEWFPAMVLLHMFHFIYFSIMDGTQSMPDLYHHAQLDL